MPADDRSSMLGVAKGPCESGNGSAVRVIAAPWSSCARAAAGRRSVTQFLMRAACQIDLLAIGASNIRLKHARDEKEHGIPQRLADRQPRDDPMNPDDRRVSKFVSLVFRRRPETTGAELDQQDWLRIDVLLQKASAHGTSISLETLHKIVATNDKRRFVLSDDGLGIRANQGHLISGSSWWSRPRRSTTGRFLRFWHRFEGRD